jgi:hypothetical protein
MTAPTNARDSRRRPEALPLDWKLLSERQQRAVVDVSWLMLEALASLDQRPASNLAQMADPPLDPDRRSQIAFIDGDRGTGKTSVLLTLRRVTSEGIYAQPMPEPVERLRAAGRRIKWLETLDMEPLSHGTNLFAAILARVAATVDHDLVSPPMATALTDSRLGFEKTSADLRQLQNDAAIVWDRMDVGAPDGDPQVRALWVNQAEKAALDLHGRLGRVMDGVAKLLSLASKQEMLFVLPVDDFDLSPGHCLELLRLIRMMTTPRLVFVVAGNIRMAETVLRLKSEGDLSALAGIGAPRANDLLERASEIAANNMRKLVPPGQRITLRELTRNEALNLGRETVGKTLREALMEVAFESNQAPPALPTVTLARFLLLDQAWETPTSGADWFAGTPRQVLDYIAMLGEIADLRRDTGRSSADPAQTAAEQQKQEADDATVVRLIEEARRQVLEDWRVPISDRLRFIEKLDTAVAVRVDFRQLHVTQEYNVREVAWMFEKGQVERATPGRFRVSLRLETNAANESDIYRPTVRPTEGVSYEPPLLELPNRLGAGLLLIHDVVTSIWGGYLRHSPLPYASQGEVGPRVETVWQGAAAQPWSLLWPMPEWWTFRDIERFEQRFASLSPTASSDLGPAWLAAILSVYLEKPLYASNPSAALGQTDTLLSEVLNEFPIRTARRVLRNSVLVCAALLLAPEYQTLATQSILPASITSLLTYCSVTDATLARTVRRMRADGFPRNQQGDIVDRALLAVNPKSAVRRKFGDRLVALEKLGLGDEVGEDIKKMREALAANPLNVQAFKEAIGALQKVDAVPASLKASLDLSAPDDFASSLSNPLNDYGGGVFVPSDEELSLPRYSLPRG